MERVCIFCRIVKGELPATKLYEDDLVLAFLDIAPINKGHCLVIPKGHHNSLTTVPAEQSARMMTVATQLAAALMRATDSDGFNLLLSNGTCAGQVVPHAHLHVIPRHAQDGVSLPSRSRPYDSDEEKEALVAEVRKRMISRTDP